MQGEGRLTIVVEATTALPAVRGHRPAAGDFAIVSVRDTGSGMSPEHLDRVFEPFFTTKEVGKGTGLGLSQVYGFAKQSGGEVAVESLVGVGTTFSLYLPRTSAPAARSQRSSTAEESRNDGRVLVVEDNDQVGEFASQLLNDLGYSTLYAANADEAMAVLERERDSIDIVFSDVVMPGDSGVELGRRVRDRWPDLAVLLTSGYSHVLADDAHHGFDLLHKPYSVEELSRALRQARRAKP
jgi:CheY-like chemotaxis protein